MNPFEFMIYDLRFMIPRRSRRTARDGSPRRVPSLGRLATALAVGLLVVGGTSSYAQWQTQNVLVKPGWSAIYLHVDASYQSLDDMVGSDLQNPISELWLWEAPSSTLQYLTSPQTPVSGGSQWGNWARINLGVTSTINALVPNAAYLVHSVATTNYIWHVKGKPVAPNYLWASSGLNFFDFPTPSSGAPAFDAFLSLAPTLQSAITIYQYQGGNLGPINPSQLFAYHTTPVTRGQAFWMRAGSVYNNYFGPFQVALQSGGGVSFADSSSQYSVHLKNETATNVVVTLRLLPSEAPPAGQTPIVDIPPLLVRGALNTTNLTYGSTALPVGSVQTFSLAPQGQAGSDLVVVLGLNRYAMNGSTGSQYAGVLQFTDNLGFSEIDVPVSATVSSSAGLWVGSALVSQVSSYLKTYQTDENNDPVVSSNGNYTVTSVNTNLGAVASPFSLRLIVHNTGTNAVLLQRVYYGLAQGTNTIISTTESLLDPAHLDTARRITATHLPWSPANTPWPFTGQFAQGGLLTTTAVENYDDQASNPFLHTYHPDHDNLDATFQNQLPQGSESFQITRQITLNISPPGSDFTSLTTASQIVSGTYAETITLGGVGGATRNFNVAGTFALNRISSIPILLTQ